MVVVICYTKIILFSYCTTIYREKIMNAYFFPVSNEERENILNRHKEVYNGYKTLNPNPVENEQPLYIQDFANDKGGMVVNNKGEVKAYTNMGINEAKRRKPYLADDEEIKESEHMCEQCGLKESLCECGSGYMEEEECTECGGMYEQDGGESSVEQIGDSIWSSGRIWELLKEYHPEDFGDEFEFVDNMVHFLIVPYEDETYYDELSDYMKDVYGERLFDIYADEMGNEFDFGDDEDFDDEEEYVTEQSNNLLSSELDSPVGRSAYGFKSGGPEQFSDDEGEPHDGYEDDIENIQNMFDYASQHDSDPESRDMIKNLNKDMNKEFDGDEPSDDEWKAYDFVSGGPPGVTFREEVEEGDEELDEKWSEKYKKSIDCNNPKGFSQKAHCQGKKKESNENVEEEVDEDLKESFSKQRKLTLEMFERFGRYN
jgi:hypothetical protein